MTSPPHPAPVRNADGAAPADPGERDARLVTEACGGSAHASAQIYEQYSRLVYKVCWSLLRRHEDVEDAVQETFVKAFGKLSRLKDGRTLRSWLCQIARRHCLDRLREQPVDQFDFDGDSPPRAAIDGESRLRSNVDVQHAVAALRGCIAAMEETLQDLLRWRCGGYSPTMVAEVLRVDGIELKRSNDTLRYRLESCMGGKGYDTFRLKTWLEHEAGSARGMA